MLFSFFGQEAGRTSWDGGIIDNGFYAMCWPVRRTVHITPRTVISL